MAVLDAEKAIEMEDWYGNWSIKAHAYLGMNKYEEAIKILRYWDNDSIKIIKNKEIEFS